MAAARTPRRHRPLHRRWAGALLSLLVALGLASLDGAAQARTGQPQPIGSDTFRPTLSYRGDFPDPAVVRYGRTYYAYGTTISSLNLPVLASSDLVHWRAVGEGLAKAPSWSQWRRTGPGRRFAATWAPAVAAFQGRWVHAYAVRVRGPVHKMCVSLSRSRLPMRGFRDRSRAPVVCYPDRGAIDPAFFTGPTGQRYLLWKSEQTARAASSLWIAAMTPDGRRRSTVVSRLLTTEPGWEGPLIENPSMIRYAGRYYLFYSGGSYTGSGYATGYAVCTTPRGPCTRASTTPLLATGGAVAGPGGASAFLDAAGRLRLAYAAWNLGQTGYPTTTACLVLPQGCAQRRLHVATLGVVPDGSGQLQVLDRG